MKKAVGELGFVVEINIKEINFSLHYEKALNCCKEGKSIKNNFLNKRDQSHLLF